jgi:RHS repeat-associated protein
MNYDAANELLNVNAATYTYDLNGNRTQKIDGSTSTAYTYDDENRLVRVEITGSTTTVITYAYDPFGRRIEKNVNGTITRYLYDQQAVILEYDQAGTVQTRYTHGPGIDEPLAMEKNSLMYYYHADGLGSIVALTNTSGGVAQRYNYDAFGNITSGAPTVMQPYTYTAREYDPETGLYFYRTRYYDPKAGRFLTRDPIGFEGGDVNLYSYVQNNPINKIDPLGLAETSGCPKKSCWERYWEDVERNRVPGAELFGLPTGFISGGLTAFLTAGPWATEKLAQHFATGAFESQRLTGHGIYLKNYRPGFFSLGTAARLVGRASSVVTVFYLSTDVTTLVYTWATFDCEDH